MSGSAPECIAALGAGRMGRGIAIVFAYAGHPVILIDLKPRDAGATAALQEAAMRDITAQLAALAATGLFAASETTEIMRRIEFVPAARAEPAIIAADVLFEGVPEVMATKQETLAFASKLAHPEAIIASTTSTILVEELARHVVRPERFLNAHWLNPAYLIPLVELSPGEMTNAATLHRLKALLERIGKVPVVCAAAPGYIVPRIQALAMNEAARLVEAGIASAEDIDKATRYGFGFRFAVLGLLEFTDWGGGDILYYASRYLAGALGDQRFAAPAIIDANMRNGLIGLGAGRGFYDYRDVDVAAYRQQRIGQLVGLLKHLGLARAPGASLADPLPAERSDD